MGGEGAVSIIYKREFQAIEDESARDEKRAQRVAEMKQKFQALEREWAQDFIDPRDTRPFLIKALKMLANKHEEKPQKKHENMRL